MSCTTSRTTTLFFSCLAFACLPGCLFVVGEPPFEHEYSYEHSYDHDADAEYYDHGDEDCCGHDDDCCGHDDDCCGHDGAARDRGDVRHGDAGSSDEHGRGRRDRIVVGDSETIGPFSEGILAGPFFFASGQIPRDPDTGDVITGDITNGTRYVLEGLSDTLAEAGLGLEDVVKVTVYLKDMSHYTEMNRIYAEFFDHSPPARATVEVSALARDAVIEIDLIAVRR